MGNLEAFARKALRTAAALAPALLVLGAAGGQQVSANPVGHKSAKPAASVLAVRPSTVAEIDTQENRQLVFELTSTFYKSLAEIYIPNGPGPAYNAAAEPWKDQNLMAMVAKVPDRQLFVAVETIAELPDLGKKFIGLQEDMNRNTWGGETQDVKRQETADIVRQKATDYAQLLMFGGRVILNATADNPSPDSFWATHTAKYIAGFAPDKRPNETNMGVLRRYFDTKQLGPNSTKVATAIIYLQKTGARPPLKSQGPGSW